MLYFFLLLISLITGNIFASHHHLGAECSELESVPSGYLGCQFFSAGLGLYNGKENGKKENDFSIQGHVHWPFSEQIDVDVSLTKNISGDAVRDGEVVDQNSLGVSGGFCFYQKEMIEGVDLTPYFEVGLDCLNVSYGNEENGDLNLSIFFEVGCEYNIDQTFVFLLPHIQYSEYDGDKDFALGLKAFASNGKKIYLVDVDFNGQKSCIEFGVGLSF